MSPPAAYNCLRLALAAAVALLLASLPAGAAAAAPQKLKVDIKVTVHNSEVGVSPETLDDMVEKLLEEAGFQVEETAADSATIELKIDVYKDGNRFKVVGDLDDPRDEDEEEQEERLTEEQDQIDELVTAIVNDFIRMLRNP